MKKGRAYLFTDRAFRFETREGRPKYLTWVEFREDFATNFFVQSEVQAAITRLGTSAYHQGSRTVDDYTDEFCDLVDKSGYKEGLTLVVKYRKGLNPDIQSAIATMTTGQPGDDQPEEWYRAAIKCDENRLTNEAFLSTKPSTRSNPAPVRTNNSMFRTSTTFAAPTMQRMAPIPAPVVPALPPPVPMDVDAVRRPRANITTCYRCGKTGHLQRECPQRYDTRFMTTEERAEFAQDIFAMLDAQPGQEPEVKEVEGKEEDFATSSG